MIYSEAAPAVPRRADSANDPDKPQTALDSALPGPEDRPQADLLIYDGQCRICTASIRGLNRWDWRNRLAFLSLHDPRVRELCPDLSHDDLMREIYLLEPGGRRYGGVNALRIAARKVPVLWPIVPFLYIPGSLPIWAAAYRIFARWRYKFGRRDACEDGTCAVHFGKSKSSR
jgi:predicted DCC family thiol-disulfide oxidoreductase YuxK